MATCTEREKRNVLLVPGFLTSSTSFRTSSFPSSFDRASASTSRIHHRRVLVRLDDRLVAGGFDVGTRGETKERLLEVDESGGFKKDTGEFVLLEGYESFSTGTRFGEERGEKRTSSIWSSPSAVPAALLISAFPCSNAASEDE